MHREHEQSNRLFTCRWNEEIFLFYDGRKKTLRFDSDRYHVLCKSKSVTY